MSLCWRLLWQMFFFTCQLLFLKIQQQKIIPILLTIFFAISWLINFNLFIEKNTPKTSFVSGERLPQLTQQANIIVEHQFTQEELRQRLDTYQKLEAAGVNNLYLFLNLRQLQQIDKQLEKATEYQVKAQNIQPIKFLDGMN